MTKKAQMIVSALQQAIGDEMIRKAKLGHKAVIADEKGQAKILSAKTIVRKMREQGLIAANGIN